jgi:anaerobic selenocysteine-containing dehydrogenase
VEPPAGSDVVAEWEFFYGLAQRMGLDLRLYPIRAEVGALRDRRAAIDLDMERKPDTDELFELLSRGSRVPLSEVRRHTRGGLFPCDPVEVAASDADCDARLELGEGTMLSELGEVAEELRDRTLEDERYPFRLVSRRLPNVYNSSGHGLPAQRKRRYNPAFLHPADLEALGVSPGDVVEITSDHASIRAIVDAAPELRRGVISMAHCFGDLPDRDSPLETGTNTGILVSVDRDYDRYTGIPRMSAIPVSVERSR